MYRRQHCIPPLAAAVRLAPLHTHTHNDLYVQICIELCAPLQNTHTTVTIYIYIYIYRGEHCIPPLATVVRLVLAAAGGAVLCHRVLKRAPLSDFALGTLGDGLFATPDGGAGAAPGARAAPARSSLDDALSGAVWVGGGG